MQIFGTGYNIKEQGGKLVLKVGFCHPVEMPIPKGVKVEIKCRRPAATKCRRYSPCAGADKQELGQFAASRPQGPSAGAVSGQGHSLYG